MKIFSTHWKEFRVQVINLIRWSLLPFTDRSKAKLTRIRTFPTAEESAAGWLIGQTRERNIKHKHKRKVERKERNFFLPWNPVDLNVKWTELSRALVFLLCVLISRKLSLYFVTRLSNNKQFRKCKRWKVNNWTNKKVDKLLIFERPWKLSKDF